MFTDIILCALYTLIFVAAIILMLTSKNAVSVIIKAAASIIALRLLFTVLYVISYFASVSIILAGIAVLSPVLLPLIASFIAWIDLE